MINTFYVQNTNLFPGFYETCLYDTEFFDNENENERENEIDNFNFDSYKNAVSKGVVLYWSTFFENDSIIKSIKFVDLWSPEYYNYTTDMVNIKVMYNSRNLKNWLLENDYFRSDKRFFEYTRQIFQHRYEYYSLQWQFLNVIEVFGIETMIEYYIYSTLMNNSENYTEELFNIAYYDIFQTHIYN